MSTVGFCLLGVCFLEANWQVGQLVRVVSSGFISSVLSCPPSFCVTLLLTPCLALPQLFSNALIPLPRIANNCDIKLVIPNCDFIYKYNSYLNIKLTFSLDILLDDRAGIHKHSHMLLTLP